MASQVDNFNEKMEKIAQMSLNKQVDMLIAEPELLQEPAIKKANSTVSSLTVHILTLPTPTNFKIQQYSFFTEDRINSRSVAEGEKSLELVKSENGKAKQYPMHQLTPKNYILFSDADMNAEGEGRRDDNSNTIGAVEVDCQDATCKCDWAVPCKTAQLDLATVELLISAFPGLTELIFVNQSERFEQFIDCLVAMLKSNWAPQLTSFTLVNVTDCRALKTETLFDAVNSLPNLKKLYIVMGNPFILQPLPILSKLETVHFSVYNLEKYCPHNERVPIFKNSFGTFMRSLENYASDGLEVDLPNAHFLFTEEESHYTTIEPGEELAETGRQLISPLASLTSKIRVVRLNNNVVIPWPEEFSPVVAASTFPWLTSLSIKTTAKQVPELFSALAQLNHLLHLDLWIDFEKQSVSENMPLLPPPTVSLPSVKALDLDAILSHYQIEWLNLPLMFPSLEAIFLKFFACFNCFHSYGIPWGTETERMMSQFHCSQVLPLLRTTNVSDENIIFYNDNGELTFKNAEDGLLAFQFDQLAPRD